MRLTLLGTGTSMGVPVIGCECPVCISPDPQNKRLRTSALIEAGETSILIDAGPDLRTQMLRAKVRHLDAVLLTHAHADHVGGIDDLRPFTMGRGRSLPIYGNEATLARVRHQYDYAFDPAPSLSTRPRLELCPLDGPFYVGAIPIDYFEVRHGPQSIVGYRFGRLAYITDGKSLPEATMAKLHDLDVLIINALRYADHPLHFTVDQALDIVRRVRPRRAYFVHLTHDLDHATANAALPAYAQLAYDGQVIEIPAKHE
jgi:phosphoribosyl 1,2-cyclic phosphate phosphodiesterase